MEDGHNFHIIILEMEAVQPALAIFRDRIIGEPMILMSDNITVVAYIKKNKATMSHIMCDIAQEILTLAQQFVVHLMTMYIPGKNILTGQLSRLYQAVPTGWSLLSQVFEDVLKLFDYPLIDLFTTCCICMQGQIILIGYLRL